MNWKELYALVNENIKNAVSGLYKPAGDVTFAELPELSQSVLGYTYTVTDAFTTDSRFTDYDTEAQAGHSFPADTEVAVIVTGTTENPVYMFNVMGGIMDGYATKGDLDNYVEKEAGKSLSTNDYTDADKALVQDSPITVTATGAEITASTAQGNPNTITIYGKSEVVDGTITSAGEGYAVVRLADLTWSITNNYFTATLSLGKYATNSLPAICQRYTVIPNIAAPNSLQDKQLCVGLSYTGSNRCNIIIKDTDYTTIEDFVASIGDATLCYQLADPTQGNTIAVKTDDGSGIDGTMWTFTTGTPLRGIPDTTVRDGAVCDGQTGAVTKKCGEVDLSSLSWAYATSVAGTKLFFSSKPTNIKPPSSGSVVPAIVCANYTVKSWEEFNKGADAPNGITVFPTDGSVRIVDTAYNDAETFKSAMSGVKLVYELAAPTTETMTSAEIQNFNDLRTFTLQTHITNNAGAEMTASAYAGTANGKAVNELKQDVQSEISALKITQSATLTLTVADWSSNQQTVTYAHNTAKRNVIDVDPASVEEWASCGVLAIAETATGVTFKCSTVPENALTFRVTSMGVN